MKFKSVIKILLLINIISAPSIAQIEFNGKSVVGEWRIVDVKTDDDKIIVSVSEENGKYVAKILSMPYLNAEKAEKMVCNKCEDNRKGQKILGMNFITELSVENDKLQHGNYLDFEKGKIHKCSIWLENEDRLKVRIAQTILFKDEVWLRKS